MYAALRARRSDFELSLLLLGFVLVIAMTALALEGNWPKVVRIAAAFTAYVGILIALTRAQPPPRLYAFVLAGATAGLISGLVRPEPMTLVFVLTQGGAGALLLAPAHWLGLRYHRRLRRNIEG